MASHKQKSFCSKCRKYAREYNEATGIHGLRYLTEKRSTTEKVVWIVILTVSLAACLCMIFQVVRKYEDGPVVISFATEGTAIYDIPFPAVTICPELKYSSKKFNYADIYFKILKNRSHEISDTEWHNFGHINLLCESEDEWTMGNSTLENDFYETIHRLAPEFEMDCILGEKNCSMLFTPILIDQGICYSFNVLNRDKIFREHIAKYANFYNASGDSSHFNAETGYDEQAGIETYPMRGLMYGADNSLDIYLGYNSNDTDYVCNGFLQGHRILIHNPWDVPHLSNYYFRVPLDKIVVAAVDPEVIVISEAVKKFKPQSRNCYLTNERPLRHFQLYTESNCVFECLTNYTFQKCNCVEFYMPRDNSTPICGSGNSKCVTDAESELRVEDLKRKFSGEGSLCDCLPQCTSLNYHVETSHSDFYWKEYFKVRKSRGIHDFDNYDDKVHHWSVVSVYFKKSQFMTLERNELYGTSDLISNFGGLLGLFTGFSLISLAEILYYLSLRIICNCRLFGRWFGQ